MAALLIVVGAGNAWAQQIWTGQGDQVSWSDPGNWVGGTVPGALDSVLIDNSSVTENFSVNLPGAATTVTLARLTIAPGPGKTITLTLPTSNTGNPGLRVGDGIAGTEDITLAAGAILRNSSGAPFGNGVEVYSLSNGILRIGNGARYLHNTARGASGVVPGLSTAVGTEHGVFEYDVPGTAVSNIAASGRTYGDLVLTRSAGSATYAAFGSSALTIRGDLLLGAGITLNSTMSGALILAGHLTNNGTELRLPANQSLTFNGSGIQLLSGANGLQISGSSQIGAGGTLAVAGVVLTNDGSMSVFGSLRLDQGASLAGSGTYAYDATTGGLIFNNSSGSRVVNDETFWPASQGPANVTVLGAGGLTMNTSRTVSGTFEVRGPVANAQFLTLGGITRFSSGALFIGSPTYGGNSTLVYATGYTLGSEWGDGGTVGVGVPKHVVIDAGGGTVALPSDDRYVPGDCSILSGTLNIGPDFGELLVLGNFTIHSGLGFPDGRLAFSGAQNQVVSSPSELRLQSVGMRKTGGVLTIACNLYTTGGTIGDEGSGGMVSALDFSGTSDSMDLNGHTLTLLGSVGGSNPTASLRGGPTSNLVLGGSGPVGTLRFAAGSQQLNGLTVNRSGTGNVTIDSPLMISGTLALTKGAVITGSHTLTIAPGASVVRSTGLVIGTLQKTVPTGNPTMIFELGSGGVYAGLDLAFTSVTATGTITATTVSGDHPDIASSPMNPSRSVNRFWRATHDGVAFDHCDATFHFAPTDLDPTVNTGSVSVWKYDAPAWVQIPVGVRASTSTEALGITGFSDFAIADLQSFPLEVGPQRNDRYSLEVSFPSAPSNRIVVDESVDPGLGNLDPTAIAGRTITVYRDGRVQIGQPQPELRSLGQGKRTVTGGMAAEWGGATPTTAQLHATFVPIFTTFPAYFGSLAPAWGDADNDGDLDIPLYRNDGNGSFSEMPGFRAFLNNANFHGTSWCDYDKDGDRDLIVLPYNTTTGTSVRAMLLRNQGDGTFVDVAPSQGMDAIGRGETPVWGDFNGDGWPDLFTPYHNHQIAGMLDRSYFYRNNGNGTFTETSDAAGVGMVGTPVGIKPEGADAADWDDDGDLDLYTASHLFVNDGTGVFTDVRAAVGLPGVFDEGCAFVDYDNDGDFDLYVRNIDRARLFRNTDGQFTDVSDAAGITATTFLWGDSWADVDNDGDIDLLQHERSLPARMMLNNGDGTFTQDPTFTHVASGPSAWADLDGDGDLDFVDNTPPTAVYANQLNQDPNQPDSYLRVRVLDAQGIETQHGATVKLRRSNGPQSTVQTRAVGSGQTYLSHNEYAVHFGLGITGIVTRNPDLPGYDTGTPVQLTAVPSPGYHFVQWTGDATGSTNPLDVIVDGMKHIEAQFEVNQYSLSIGSLGNGTAAPTPALPTYAHGQTVQILATPDLGYNFVSWGGDASGNQNPLAFAVVKNSNVTATFAINSYTLGIATVGTGSVAVDPNQATYTFGSLVELTALPGVGYHFNNWSGDATGTANPLALTMDVNKNVTAVFQPNAYTLDLTASSGGSVVRSPDQPTYLHGAVVQITPSALPHYHFVGWSGDASGSANPLFVTMDGNKVVSANFAIDTHTLAVTVAGSGSVSRNPDLTEYPYGSTVQLTANPGIDYHFTSWSGAASGAQNPIVVTMNGDQSVTATFDHDDVPLDVTIVGSGSVIKNPNNTLYPFGSNVTLTATPDVHYVFAGWSGDASGSTNPLAVTMNGPKNIVATFSPGLPIKWVGTTGGGDGISWNGAANWAGGVVPASNNDVWLDNSTVAANYSVNLPSGATTVTIGGLVITPAVGRTITLTLPSSNTANPGLRAGDTIAGTEDIVLGSGAVLSNASGAASGNGIETGSSSNGIVRLDNGSRYVHATLRSVNGIRPRLSTVAGTETGEFEYDVPGRANFAITASGANYGSLTLTRTAGTAIYTASGASALTVRGSLELNSGITFTSTMSGALNLAGDLTNDGVALALPATQAVVFNGAAVQRLTGSAGTTLGGVSTVNAGATLAITSAPFTNNSVMTVQGSLQIDQGAAPGGIGSYVYNASTGTLIFNNSTGPLTITSVAYWPSTNGPPNLTVQNTGGINMNVSRTLSGLCQIGDALQNSNRLTLNGTLQMNAGASISGSPGYGANSTLVYNAPRTVGAEWGSGAAVGSGVPKNVTLQHGSGNVTMPSSGRTVPGDLTITSGAMVLSTTSGGDLGIGGNFSNSGTLTPNGRMVSFTGSGTQTITAPGGASFDRLGLTKTGGTVRLMNNVTCTGTGGSALSFSGTTDVLDLNGNNLTLSGTIGGTNAAGSIRGHTSSNLTINGTGALGTLRFNVGNELLRNLTVNRTSTGTVTLGSALTVNNALTLTNGAIVTGSNTLKIATGASVTRSSGFVSGNLQKTISTGPTAVTFEVGTGTVYAPVTLAFGNVTTVGTVTASSTAGDHPNLSSSSLNPAHGVNRYWTLANAGTVFDQYDGTFAFAAGDVDPGSTTSAFVVRRYVSPTWFFTANGIRTATSTQAAGLTTFGAFAIGETQSYTLTLTPAGNGMAVRNPDQPTYDHGVSVVLTATPTAGHSFVGWSGDTTGATNPLTLLATKNRNITAQFTYSLSTTAVGNGSVSKSPDQTGYNPGASVQLTATPQAGYHFVSWSGDTTGTTSPITIVMNANKSVTATFAINTYTLNVGTVGNGSVVKNPDQPTYNHGTSVQLTATPTAGQFFVGWSGDASGTTNPLTVAMNGNKNLTAIFSFSLNVSVVGNGSVVKSPNQTGYTPGTSVQLTPSAPTGYRFLNWSGDASGFANPLTVLMTSNKNITATFVINTYTLGVPVVGSGSVNKAPDQANYDYGTIVQLAATPGTGHHFVSWSGDATGTTTPINVTMDANKVITATFAINTYTLNLSVVGSGTVEKDPEQPTYNHGEVVEIRARESNGWHFVAWSGDVTSTQDKVDVTMNSDKNATATFAIDTHTLAVSTAGDGGVSKNPDQPAYDHGSSVVLTATPGPGQSFLGWTGDITGSQNPITVVMNGDYTCTATFSYTVNVSATNGAVTKSPDQPNYAPGTVVQLTPAPAAGYHFVNWSGDASGSANPLILTVNANQSVTANFAINTYPLNVTVVGNGSVVKNPDQPSYDHGSIVQLTPAPAVNSHFVGWSGDASGSTNPLSVTMDGAKNVTATFALDTYALDVTVVGSGSVAKTPDQPSYDHGSVVQLAANPAAGYLFSGWSDEASGTANPLSVTMDGEKSITATFTEIRYLLITNVIGSGSIAKSPDQPDYGNGSVVQLSAAPAVGHHFVEWSGDTSGGTNPIDVTMRANQSVTATFAINTYALDVTVTGSGSVVKNPDQPSYDHGSIVQLTPVPGIGYHFLGWSGDAGGSANPLSVTMNGARNVTATFAINTYTLDVTLTGCGSVAKNPDQPSYSHGTVVQIIATPCSGHHFGIWSGDASGSANPLILTVNANQSVTANFAINTYPLNVTVVGNGGVVKNPDQPSYDHGSVVQLTPTPAVGYHFVGWSGDTTGSANPLALTMNGNRSVTATYEINTYALNVTVVGSGGVTKDPDQPSYPHGSGVELTATPAVGYGFSGWSGDTSGSTNPLSMAMNGNKTITATFAINTYALSVAAVGNGGVTKTPDQATYDHGTPVQLAATPDAGYAFTGWSGDTASAANPLDLVMSRPMSLTATFTFQEVRHVVAVSTIGSGSVIRSPDQESYLPGTLVRLTALADPGNEFTEWTGDISGVGNPYDVTVDGDLQIVARFSDTASPTVHVIDPDGGEALGIGRTYEVRWFAEDVSGVAGVDIYVSRNDVSGPFDRIAADEANDGSYFWAVDPPATGNAILMVVARDTSGNFDSDISDAPFTISGGPLAADDAPVSEFALAPVSPNPIRSAARILYSIPREAEVRLSILDVQGREVVVIDRGRRSPGRYHATWDARGASSGTYFIRFQTPGKTWVRRIVVAR